MKKTMNKIMMILMIAIGASSVAYGQTKMSKDSKVEAQIVALDDALNRLAVLDRRKSRVVEMKFFGGLNVKEIARVLNVSPETVKRDWSFSRTWLLRELSGAE